MAVSRLTTLVSGHLQGDGIKEVAKAFVDSVVVAAAGRTAQEIVLNRIGNGLGIIVSLASLGFGLGVMYRMFAWAAGW